MSLSTELISQYLRDAVAAEKRFEGQLRTFAQEGDDQDVQRAFIQHADETQAQYRRLSERLAALGYQSTESQNTMSSIADFAPKFAELGSTPEERLLQNLITAFCIETGEIAMYEALAAVAQAAGDFTTETLARDIQTEEQRTAEKVFHFLPTRSKIAFNVLTADEVDPAVQTKVGEGLV